MDETPNLGLPYILAAQSQKHVTHNEAIRALDAIVQLSVLDRDLAAPPGSPTNGARYIVAASPTGAWAGHAGDIAAYQDGAWAFYDPVEGFIAWVADEDAAVVWNGSAWTALTTGSGGAGSFSTVGINATADATNKLAVAAAATLFNHAGAGHQLKINKASSGDTASLLYQDGFSGRAELGLAGDDDFHFKVSADGSTWKEAIVIDRTSGAASFPLTPGRPVLTANRTYYVRTDGSDANTGLANTSGGAFLTIQKAIDVVYGLDRSIYNVTVQVGDGTYTAGAAFGAMGPGSGAVILQGNATTPGNCLINVSGSAIFASSNAIVSVAGFEVRGFYGVAATGNAVVTIVGAMKYGACTLAHKYADTGGFIFDVGGNYTISGSVAVAHTYSTSQGRIWTLGPSTITLTGTPNFGAAFAYADANSTQRYTSSNITFSGSATGARYNVSLGAGVATEGGGASFLPGGSAGSATSPGWYN